MPIGIFSDDVLAACLAAFSLAAISSGPRRVSKAWRRVADSNALWRPHVVGRWPQLAALQHVESFKALFRSRLTLETAPPPPPVPGDFQFLVVLRSSRLNITLLRESFVGNENMVFNVTHKDFLTSPDVSWLNFPDVSWLQHDLENGLYDGGLNIEQLFKANQVKVSVEIFRAGGGARTRTVASGHAQHLPASFRASPLQGAATRSCAACSPTWAMSP